MKAVILKAPGEAVVAVRRVGLCGSDLNSFRGKNPLVKFPRILGHEVTATIVEGAERIRCSSAALT